MKRMLTSAFVLLLVSGAAYAQADSAGTRQHNHQKMQNSDAYKQLNLSAEQQAQLKIMRDDFKKQRDALNAQKLTQEERRTAMQTLQQQHKAKMEALLTPAQKDQLSKQKTDRAGRMNGTKRGRGDNSRAGYNSGFQNELNLTTEQQAKMKEIRTEFKGKAQTLRNDQTLTREQKREKLRDLMQAQQSQIQTVLTKEQQEKWQSLRKERAARNTR